jgi:hypothetical protein
MFTQIINYLADIFNQLCVSKNSNSTGFQIKTWSETKPIQKDNSPCSATSYYFGVQ